MSTTKRRVVYKELGDWHGVSTGAGLTDRPTGWGIPAHQGSVGQRGRKKDNCGHRVWGLAQQGSHAMFDMSCQRGCSVPSCECTIAYDSS
jgi:hypothetical protein